MPWTVTPLSYRKTVLGAAAALGGIVLTGAAVRLTDSGLGCDNWPKCTESSIVPAWQFHTLVEYGNRLLTFAVSAAVAVAVLSAHRRQPRRPDLIWWAWGLVLGVAAQAVVGGITVHMELHPLMVGSHFLLSMVTMWNVLVLWVRSGSGPGPTRPLVPRSVLNHARGLVLAGCAVLFTGTLVTGAGPNAGDARAQRLGFRLVDIARVHSATVWLFTVIALALAIRLARHPGTPARLAQWLMAAVVAQGAVGYIQYALGVPPALVELHILGALAVWSVTLLVYLNLFRRPPLEAEPAAGANSPGAVTVAPVLDRIEA